MAAPTRNSFRKITNKIYLVTFGCFICASWRREAVYILTTFSDRTSCSPEISTVATLHLSDQRIQPITDERTGTKVMNKLSITQAEELVRVGGLMTKLTKKQRKGLDPMTPEQRKVREEAVNMCGMRSNKKTVLTDITRGIMVRVRG